MARSRAPNVEKLRRKGDVSGLERALAYTDPRTEDDGRIVDSGIEVRLEAVAALAEQDDPRAHYALVRGLSDREEEVRVAAIRGLRERGDPAAVEPLMVVVLSWLGPERERSREEALEGLAALGDPEVLRRAAGELAGRSIDYAAADAEVVSRLAIAAERDALRPTVEELVDDLRDPARALRARTLLAWVGDDSVEPLIEALDDEQARGAAALTLGSIRDSRAVESLSSLAMTCEDAEVRKAAVWALGEIRDPSAVEALLTATADSDYGVRAEASSGFDKLGNAGVAVALSSLVQPALESAAEPPAEAIGEGDPAASRLASDGAALPAETPEPEEPAAAGAPSDGSPEAAEAPRPSPAPPVPPAPRPLRARGERAGPVLRRLLGLDD